MAAFLRSFNRHSKLMLDKRRQSGAVVADLHRCLSPCHLAGYPNMEFPAGLHRHVDRVAKKVEHDPENVDGICPDDYVPGDAESNPHPGRNNWLQCLDDFGSGLAKGNTPDALSTMRFRPLAFCGRRLRLCVEE